ncbi:hypothetical protein VTO58DRAFT_108115 [Aureobasidium pullulans]
MPDDTTLLKHERELAELVKDLDWQSEGLPVADQKALEIIDATWKPNVTLVDIDWDTVRDGGKSKDIPDFCFDSPDVAQKLFNPDEDTVRELKVKSFWGWFTMFFSHVSKSIKDIRSRTCVELVVGEMNECLERLRYDAWSTRGEKQGKLDPALFPRTYNRVQMSNIPLIGQFHKIGYPAHWLSEVLGNLLEGTIMTNARAPRKEVLTIKEAQKTYPSRAMCVKPWIAELSTLVSIWKDVLPFGLLFSNDLIPNLNAVRQYTIKFPTPNGCSLDKSVFALVFWNSAQEPPPTNLRATLLDDEQGDRSESARNIRESGIHVLSTFKWTQETRTVSFWLRSDVVETMEQGDWNAYIWRLDSWGCVTAGVSVRDHVVAGPNWIGEKV